MGCFNFECGECGWGPNGRGEDGREYFGKEAAVVVELTTGKCVIIHGHYTGYGEVETPTGHTFYPEQFEEYWADWLDYKPNNKGEKGPFIAKEIYCEECLYGRDPTPLVEYDFTQMKKVVDYLAKEEAPAAGGAGAAAPAPAPAKAKKAPKPKALTKDQLAAKVAELEAEVGRLKPIAERASRLDEMSRELQAKYPKLRGCMDKMKDLFRADVGYW